MSGTTAAQALGCRVRPVVIRQALIFAAGLGERMRPLSERTPKPLLQAGGKPLVVWHLERLAACGVREVIVNTSHLAEQFPAALGDGARFGLRIEYSKEGAIPLETGGGMLHALALIGDEPFIAVNGDIWSDFDFRALPCEPEGIAHLVLVDNPSHHPQGDFGVDRDGRLLPLADSPGTTRALTFAGIGVYRPELLDNWRAVIGETPGANATPPRFSIVPLLRARMPLGKITWQRHGGAWLDIGTPQRLAQLDARLRHQG
ncbi:MAG: N-acetylmuramate alpha-1-phosphate uridylyltransferase MurU [Rhodanobacteraceae bacterium]